MRITDSHFAGQPSTPAWQSTARQRPDFLESKHNRGLHWGFRFAPPTCRSRNLHRSPVVRGCQVIFAPVRRGFELRGLINGFGCSGFRPGVFAAPIPYAASPFSLPYTTVEPVTFRSAIPSSDLGRSQTPREASLTAPTVFFFKEPTTKRILMLFQ